MKKINNRAIIYLAAGVICGIASLVWQNYIFMCIAAMWLCLGVLYLKKR